MSDKLRILIVDDDRRMVKTLVDILKTKDYEAEAALKISAYTCLYKPFEMQELGRILGQPC